MQAAEATQWLREAGERRLANRFRAMVRSRNAMRSDSRQEELGAPPVELELLQDSRALRRRRAEHQAPVGSNVWPVGDGHVGSEPMHVEAATRSVIERMECEQKFQSLEKPIDHIFKMTEHQRAIDDRRREETMHLYKSMHAKNAQLEDTFNECFEQYEEERTKTKKGSTEPGRVAENTRPSLQRCLQLWWSVGTPGMHNCPSKVGMTCYSYRQVRHRQSRCQLKTFS